MRTRLAQCWLGLLIVCLVFTGGCGLRLPRCEQQTESLESSLSGCDSPLDLRRFTKIPPEAQVAMFRISDAIRRTETEDGGILLDVHHGQMFCLNVVGAKILELMQRGYDETRITDEVSRDYGVGREVVRADVRDFIESLHKHHILQPARSRDVV